MRASFLAGVVAFGFLGMAPAFASPVFQFTSTQTSLTSIDASFGYSFTVSTPQTVTALDVFGASAQGNTVRIYNQSGTIVSAVVSSADPTVTVGASVFFMQAITPTLLEAGIYFIVADIPAFDPIINFNAVNLASTVPGITFGAGVSQGGFGNPTTNVVSADGATSFLTPNFEVAVPEPVSLAMLGMGVAGIAATRRRRAR